MGLTLTVLGSSGTYASVGNACSGYLLDDGETRVWLDCGPGTLANLQRHVALDDLDAVVVSHSHPDHWLELPVLHNALKYGVRRAGLPVFGTSDTLGRLEAVLGGRPSPTLDWNVIADRDAFAVGTLSFRCARTDHPVETLSVRVDTFDGAAGTARAGRAGHGGPRSLVYSADTGPGWTPSVFGPGIDVALLEATLLESTLPASTLPDPGAAVPRAGPERGAVHLSAGQAGTLAREADAGRLLITHLLPGSDREAHRREAEATFGATVEIASVNERYEI